MNGIFLIGVYFIVVVHQCFTYSETVTGNSLSSNRKPFVINADEEENINGEFSKFSRLKRDINSTNPVNIKINSLNDRHKQLMVHWVGEGSSVIICLARDPPMADNVPVSPSAMYISYDYGDTYSVKTDDFKLANGTYSMLEKFYNHPKFNTHLIFTDVKHKTIFLTDDHGKTIKRVEVDFAPTDISFNEYSANTFLVHDKNDPKQSLYLTEDFGKTFTKIREFVKSIHWMKDSKSDSLHLIEYRLEPSGLGSILHSNTMFKVPPASIYSFNIKDLFIKDNYIFTTKQSDNGNVDLHVSYKFGQPLKCIFDTQLDRKSYFVVDVTENRAMVAVSHGRTMSHLYVSDNLSGTNGIVEFTLSLEQVLCYFPNNTWHDTLLELMAEDTFADVYKVEGMPGTYIASRIVNKPTGNNLSPQNLGSVITFDHGASWRLIRAPDRDNEGQLITCDLHKNCSLHLNQKFSHLYPNTKTSSILSSKSAPGLLIATGIIGSSLKGHYGVYVSSDGGWTWRQALKDLYLFNMGDHGGLLTAVKYYKSRGETKQISYSTDEGETWKQVAFNKENLRLYGLMTQPGENTTIFTMFGSLPEFHQWIIIKLDLLNVFSYKCAKDDYKTWSPSQSDGSRSYVPCIMGQQRTYQKRIAHVNCYNGLNYDTPVSMEPCNCDILDYECDFGFVHTGKYGQCVRNKTVLMDPYKVPETCHPGNYYNRTKGYRKISGDQCIGGFEKHYLPDQVPCPFNEVQDFLLFAQRERISRFNLVTRTMEELPVKNLKNVIAIDFDMRNNCVYWADIQLDILGRQCFKNGSGGPEILVSSDLASIEGMALDWLSNTLYFVDGSRSKIELIKTDINHSGRMRKTVLGPNTLKKPRGIALHPKHGYMFWTDWSGENPSVNRANLDGTRVKPLFKKPTVEWPNGITVDYIAERIYWVDAKQDYIASADLHGDDMKFVIKDNDVVSHPFAVAVFKNTMFWDDWKRSAIFSADKDSTVGNLQDLEILQKQLLGLMDLKVYAHGIQIGNSACAQNACSYLCVHAPTKEGYTCLCPDGMIRVNNNCYCPGGVAVKPINGTCPKLSGTCAPEHFTCLDNSCIPNGWKCDGEPDCADGSDELNCKTQSCSATDFVCGDGKCLPNFRRCDYSIDCSDGSDESNCPKTICTKDQFTCNNGNCISPKWRCDGENDCKDNSDELNCSSPEPVVCKNDQFRCKGGGTICIPMLWRCDKEKDCKDGSDEMDCDGSQCTDDRFFCGPPSNTCIYKTWVCDGDADCLDGRDEHNCSHVVVPNRHKITDLYSSQNGTCTEWMFKCRNEKCIPYWWKCDELDDCGDGSDELRCPYQITVPPPVHHNATTPNPVFCGENQFRCSSNDCILNSYVCDGMKDCPDGEDETNCDTDANCTDSNHFKCYNDGNCIMRTLVCDHKKDCPDGTDEMYCDIHLPVPEAPSCATGFFSCSGNGRCLPLHSLCDGQTDCPDGFDESNCSNLTRVYQALQMGVDERAMNETSVLFYWWLPMPLHTKLDFMPAISKIKDKNWTNMSWVDESQFHFSNLTPFTAYNMTVYVRNKDKGVVFPPAKYFIASTREGVPSKPYNVSVKQVNVSFVEISWNKPSSPNGVLTAYEIEWRSTNPETFRSVKIAVEKDEMHQFISGDFVHNVTYYFSVTAYNRRFKGNSSVTVPLTFDQESDLNGLQNARVTRVTNTSVLLKWDYAGVIQPEGFHIDISITDRAYPKLESLTTKNREIEIDKLSPGVKYQFKLYAYKKQFVGPVQFIAQATPGSTLPQIQNIQGKLDVSNRVILKWDKPFDSRHSNWIYGVYYGIESKDLFEKAKIETENLTVTINDLLDCAIYTFTVGIVGPIGYGPLSHNWVEIETRSDPKAPPKHLKLENDVNNPLQMKLSWEPSCRNGDSIGYIIKISHKNSNKTNFVRLGSRLGNPTIRHFFNVSYGEIYNVSVATTASDAIFTEPVTFYAPAISPPYQVKVIRHVNNGSYIVYWHKPEIPKLSYNKTFKYVVYVSSGIFDEEKSEKFECDKPPFVYVNSTKNLFSFGVKLKTDINSTSSMSELVKMAALSTESKISTTSSNDDNGISLSSILMIILLISGVICIVVFFIKPRRIRTSLTRFVNSHYDTRSGAATLGDNHGLEDEIPRIQGFSDDEPLVIA